MANVKIRGHNVNIDLRDELEQFDWVRPKWSHDKLIAASPFRYDRTPSFFVTLDGEFAGAWGDSGAYDEDWRSGGFVKLLSYLRNETSEETADFLLHKYADFTENDDKRIILPYLTKETVQQHLSHDIIQVAISPYLSKRSISTEVQSQARVGKTRYNGFVGLPWHSPDGRLANVKYRATRGKTFFYEKEAVPIRTLVYGADLYVRSTDDLIVCEAEIDALSWRTAGYNAVAVGGVAFTDMQASILARLPAKRLLLAGDNDKAGQRFNARIVERMRGQSRPLALVQLASADCKDANEALCKYGTVALREAVTDALDLPQLAVKVVV